MRTTKTNRERYGRTASAADKALVTLMEMLEPRQLLSTYYVSSAGSDTASGDAMTAAWKTVTRVNSQKLKAGDTVLFAVGQTFTGTLTLAAGEAGTKTAPITFGVYGIGSATPGSRATIKSGNAGGLDIGNTAGVAINNLNFVGAGAATNTAAGIYVHVEAAGKTLSTLNLKNVDVTGYGREGMRVTVTGAGSSFNDVKIEYANLHDNLYGGLKVTGPAHNAN